MTSTSTSIASISMTTTTTATTKSTSTLCFGSILISNWSRRNRVSLGLSTLRLPPFATRMFATSAGHINSDNDNENSRIARPLQRRKTTLRRPGEKSRGTNVTDAANGPSTQAQNSNGNKNNSTKQGNKKFKVLEEITAANIDKLAAAFDELARQEGFDDNSSTQYFAADATFEDLDDDDDYMFDDIDGSLDDEDDNDDNDDIGLGSQPIVAGKEDSSSFSNNYIDPSTFRLADFFDDPMVGDSVQQNPTGLSSRTMNSKVIEADNKYDENDVDMDARIAEARSDMVTGKVSVPKPLDRMASNALLAGEMNILGFDTQADSFYGGVDEKPYSMP